VPPVILVQQSWGQTGISVTSVAGFDGSTGTVPVSDSCRAAKTLVSRENCLQ